MTQSTGRKLRVVRYARLSPSATLTRDENLKQQLELIDGVVERHPDWEVIETIIDRDSSASRGKREGWDHIVQMIHRREVDVICARHADRMYRQMRDLEDLVDLAEKTGVLLACAHGDYDLTTPSGRLTARILAAAAKNEMEMKAERQKLGHMRRITAKKPWWTRRPYGFEKDGTHRSAEAREVKRMYVEFTSGRMTLTQIANDLNARSLPTTMGNQWTQSKVRQLLVHPRNAGILVNQGEVVGPGAWKGIVKEEVWKSAVSILDQPERWRGGGGRRKGLLVGVARCAKCDSTVRQGATKPRAGTSHYERYYICSKNQCTAHPVADVDEYVNEHMLALLSQPKLLARVLPKGEDIEPLTNELRALRIAMDELGEDRAMGLVSSAEFRKLRGQQNDRQSELEAEISRATAGSVLAKLPSPEWLVKEWDNDEQVTVLLKREVFRAFLTIQLHQRQRGAKTYNADDSVTVEYGAEATSSAA